MHHFARSLVPGAARHLLPRTSRRVLIIGGGPTGLLCADRLRHHFEVTVVDSKEYFEFTPGILRALVEPAHLSRITFNYREVLEGLLGVEYVLGEATSIETATHASRGLGSVTIAPGLQTTPNRLFFDYCIVAVGVSNSMWKPRTHSHLEVQQRAPAPGPSGINAAADDFNEMTLEGRRANLRAMREKIAAARAVHVVGAGLVGVELAAEIAHFFPGQKVALVDGAPSALPQLAENSRDYVHKWMQKQGVKMHLGAPFAPESVHEDDLVLWCVGTRPRAGKLFGDAPVLRRNGQIRVNRRMQVMRPLGAAGSLAKETPGAPLEMEPFGTGRVFAVGDAASIEGIPTAQMIFHGEEMAAVAVANIEASEDITSPFALGKGRREAEPGLPLLCCTSLGPQDGMFSTQSELVATGALAAMQKQMIEETKMGALRGELLSSMLWMPIH